jgi:DnaJ-class molecular chaperone
LQQKLVLKIIRSFGGEKMKKCDKCKGSGWVADEMCPKCNGSGVAFELTEIVV